MNTAEVLAEAEKIVALSGIQIPPCRTFLERAFYIGEAAKSLTPKQRQRLPNFQSWAESFRRIYDQFDRILEADPCIAYQPANRAAREFHASDAYVRFFMSGNRCSKSQSGYTEHYLITTGQHRWRKFPKPPHATFMIGVNFNQYATGVFERKFISGEPDNPLSPIFPEGGKWLYHYDSRKHIIQIACPECAEVGKAGSCPHQKSTIQLFSDEGGWEVLQGAQYVFGHYDEHVDEGFFNEGMQRTKTVQGGCLAVTGTPLAGTEAWEIRRLYKRFLNGKPANLYDPENPQGRLFCSVHQIDQFEAGLVAHADIRASMASMDQFSIDARIFGKPAPLADNPVFDLKALQIIAKSVRDPERGELTAAKELERISPKDEVKFELKQDAPLRIWKKPEPGAVYICAVDTASGLMKASDERKGDASCASVLRVFSQGTKLYLELVAQWHGWINPFQYAEEVMKLCCFYNSALCVIELTGGLGLSVMLKIKDEFAYWNLYRERTDVSQLNFQLDPRFGVDTNASTKPFMVSSLQLLVRENRIIIPCGATIQELTAFEQENTNSAGQALLSPRFRGAKGSPDDRAMSLCIGTSVAISNPDLLMEVQKATEHQNVVNTENLDPFWQSVYGELKQLQKDGGLEL